VSLIRKMEKSSRTGATSVEMKKKGMTPTIEKISAVTFRVVNTKESVRFTELWERQ